jgi:LmbE family N-acetylglucosaminyl deacetylase
VADITDTLEQKLESIRAYKTQFPASKEYVFERVESMNRHYGQTAGFGAGELFLTHRSIGTRDVMQVVSPAHARGR